MFNWNYMSEVQFWRDYLSDTQPRLMFSFGGQGQLLLVSTSLLSGKVTWPGIPEAHAKRFANVHFQESLFSYMDIQELEQQAAAEADEWEGGDEEDDADEF